VFIARGDRILEKTFSSEIYFDDLSPEILDAYVASNEWEGKAGGFAIEETAGTLIKGIKGDFYNVMGFPLNGVCRMLIDILQEQESST
jgi:septum formation protein